MGISVEMWRARIGSFAHPNKTKRVERGISVNCTRIVSLCIRIALFALLVAQCVERNPGPTQGDGNGAGNGRGGQRGGACGTSGPSNGRGGGGSGVRNSGRGSQYALRRTARHSHVENSPPGSQHDKSNNSGRLHFDSEQRVLSDWVRYDSCENISRESLPTAGRLNSDTGTTDFDMRSLLLEIRSEVKSTNQKFDKLEKSVTELQNDNINLKERNVELTNEVGQLSSKVTFLEKRLDENSKKCDHLETLTRKQNLKIYDLNEQNESGEGDEQISTEDHVIENINRSLGLSESSESFEAVYRVRSQKSPRPVFIRCSSIKTRDRILSAFRDARKNASNPPFRIGEDLPKSISMARSKLYPLFKDSIDKNKRAYFKNDRLIVDGVPYVYDDLNKVPVPLDK